MNERAWLGPALVAAVGVALALVGTTEAVDGIVPWVYGIVDRVAWLDLWRPIYNPEPMDTYAYRPLAVALVKVGLTVADTVGLARTGAWLTAAHGLVLVAFGLSSLRLLLRLGFTPRVAALAAASALAMPSLLFSAWIVVEFDLVGATFVLLATSRLIDLGAFGSGRPLLPPSPRAFWFWAVLALLTKETSALQLLAVLGVACLRPGAGRLPAFDRAALRRLGLYLGLLALATAPMHFVRSDNLHAFTVFSEGFHPVRIVAILLHTLCQVVFLLAPAGVALLALTAEPTGGAGEPTGGAGEPTGGAGEPVSARRGVVAAAVAMALYAMSPVLRTYSHFEAIVFGDAVAAVALSIALVGGLALTALRGDDATRRFSGVVLLTLIGYALAPVVLRFARADVSARIFAACVPFLHAAVWRGIGSLWRSGRAGAVASGALGVAFVLFVVSSAWNAGAFHRSRLAVEDVAKVALSKDVTMSCPAIVATNAVQLTTTEELVSRGARLGACAWIETTTTQPEGTETLAAFIGRGALTVDPGQDAYLLVQTARSEMVGDDVNRVLAGDFAWAHDFMPEGDDDLFAAYQRMVYEVETELEVLFRREGRSLVRASATYLQLPLFWTELPARLRLGVPLVERYTYLASTYRVAARRPGYVPPGGRVRTDRRPDADRP